MKIELTYNNVFFNTRLNLEFCSTEFCRLFPAAEGLELGSKVILDIHLKPHKKLGEKKIRIHPNQLSHIQSGQEIIQILWETRDYFMPIFGNQWVYVNVIVPQKS